MQHLFAEVLEKYKNYEFQVKKEIKINDDVSLTLYDIDYYGLRLNVV